jgi:magnesium-transporting ATPase (P-type)
MDDAFIKSPSEVLKHFQVSERRGLSEERVKGQRDKFGPNGTKEDHAILDRKCLLMFIDSIARRTAHATMGAGIGAVQGSASHNIAWVCCFVVLTGTVRGRGRLDGVRRSGGCK